MSSASNRQNFAWIPATFLCCCWVGCGGVYDATVTGVVTLDGEALHRGTVAFNSTSGGPAAYAVIQGDGSYTVTTGREEGLPSSQYSVTVVARHPPEQQTGKGGGPPPPGKPIAPPWYRNQQSSGLSFTVEPGANEIDIELTSAPPPSWRPKKRQRAAR